MAETLGIAHDVLDQQILDREGRRAGRVDGLTVELREGKPPRIVTIDIGTSVLARRIWPRALRWFREPFRIPWEKVRDADNNNITVDIDAPQSDAFRIERWLRDHFIGRIPGSHG